MRPKPIYAIHGANSLDYDGWLVLTRGIGHDPHDHGSEDFRRYRQTPIVRLNNGYAPNGTIPRPEHYADFAQRCANFVAASQGCHAWIIGNEPNHAQERPQGQPIEPGDYVDCYSQCREAIRALQLHGGDLVLLAAVAPWNNQTVYSGNEAGDWVRYFEDVQWELGLGGCDGFALHTYARAQTPEAVVSADRMDPPFEMYHNGFRAYWDWMAAILPRFQGLPVHITETNANAPWQDINTGFVRAMYDEIDGWNSLHHDRPIWSLALYRWQYDQWEIWNKPNVHADFYDAVNQGYTWPQYSIPPEPPIEPPEETMQNPSLELPYEQDAQHSTVKIAHGWSWFASEGREPPAEQGPTMLPEYKPLNKSDDPRRVWDGNTAQCWFIRWKVMDAGIYQVVPAEIGAEYYFDCMAQAWCSNSDDPTVSDGEMYVSLGISPSGGDNPWAQGVIWTEWDWIGPDYVTVESRTVTAQADHITVFVRAWNKWKLSHNDVYIDDCHLTKVGGGTEPPGGSEPVDYDRIRQIVREEIDKTIWASGAG